MADDGRIAEERAEEQPKKRTGVIVLLILIAIAAAVMIGQEIQSSSRRTTTRISQSLAGSSSSSSSTTSTTSTSARSTVDVEYRIEGSAESASVTLSNEQGGTEQGDYRLPFDRSYELKLRDFAYISAQNKGEYGTITCKIIVDGETWRESTSSGAYKIATCSGMIGTP